jgi:hypothetical protein
MKVTFFSNPTTQNGGFGVEVVENDPKSQMFQDG